MNSGSKESKALLMSSDTVMAPTSCCRAQPAWRCWRVRRCSATTSRAWCRCWNARIRAWGTPASGQIGILWERCHGFLHGLVMLPVDRSQHRFPHRVLRLFPCFTLLKEQTQPGVPPFRGNPEAIQLPVLQDGAFGQSRDGRSSQFPGQARGVVSGKSLVLWQRHKGSLKQGLR